MLELQMDSLGIREQLMIEVGQGFWMMNRCIVQKVPQEVCKQNYQDVRIDFMLLIVAEGL